MPKQIVRLLRQKRFWRVGLSLLFLTTYFFNPTHVSADFLKITAPAEIFIEKPFEVNLEISAKSNTTYSLKARLGKQNQLSFGQTFNFEKNVWLSDSVSWNSFPKFKTDENGMWVGKITARTTNKITEGENLLVIRIHSESGTNTDSASYTLKVIPNKPQEETTPSPKPVIENTGKPIINEFVAQPQAGTEWVEIKNTGSGPADISGWFIDDEPGKSSPTLFPEGTVIPAGGFFVLELKSAKLNDITDMVRLLKPDGIEVESFRYEKTEKGSSWAKDSQGIWFLSQNPTQGTENPNPEPAISQPEINPTNKTTNKVPLKNTELEDQINTVKLPEVSGSEEISSVATVSASFQEKASKKPFTPALIVGFFMLGFGSVLFMKKRLQNQIKPI